MALNTGSINSRAVNNAVDAGISSTGGGVVVSIAQAVHSTGLAIASIAQNVGFLRAGALVASVAQEVELKSTSTPGTVVSIVQAVKALGTKSIDVGQAVIAVSDPTSFYGRNGYEPRIYIDGVAVPSNELHGDISCVFIEERAPQLNFSIIPPTGLQDIRSYVGKSVTYDVMTSDSPPRIVRVCTAIINTPKINILDQKIDFSCSLDIEQQAESLTRSYLNSIGSYSNNVFSKPETKLEELTDRVSTVPELINVDNYGVVNTKSITTKATADTTYTDAQVYRRDIDFVLGSRQRYINKVNIVVDYSYQRLHHMERSFTLAGSGGFCETTSNNRKILLRSLVESAVGGSSWVLKSPITYSDIWPAGWYSCSGALIGWNGGITHSAQITPVLDAAGNQVTQDGVGQTEAINSVQDNSSIFCTGAGWIMATRFSQNIENTFNLTVEAPQSIAQNGEKVKTRNYNIRDSFDSESWENYESYNQAIPDNSTKIIISGGYYIEGTEDISDYNSATNIALNTAKNEILKSHREDLVVFKRPLSVDTSLTDTIQLNTDKITAKGSVQSYTHTVHTGTGEAYTAISLVLTQSEGSATDSALAVPSLITNTPVYNSSIIALHGYFGVDPQASAYSGLGGYFTDQTKDGSFFPTEFGTSVRVITPPIEDLRTKSEVETTISYDVEIPHDTIVIDFDQWT